MTTTIIKRKSDIDNLLNSMGKGDSISIPSLFCGFGKGFYSFQMVNKDQFLNYNYGQNWNDRDDSKVDRQYVIDTIWNNRKAFNKRIKDLDGYFIERNH